MTVIVMLILAGVSLNALVGDNGIITNSMDAKMKSGIAVFEEWLQQKYVENYDSATDDDIGNEVAFLNRIFNYTLLLKDGSRDYIIYGGKVYYLLNKNCSYIPKEIKDGLVGGDTTSYAEYTRLQDVYGITKDLKVYYCNNGTEGIFGNLENYDIDPSTPAAAINSDAGLKNAITGILADKYNITVDDEKGVTLANAAVFGKDLEIDGSKYGGITNIAGLGDLKNLKQLTLTNLTLTSLTGLEGIANLEYLYLKNTTSSNFGALEACINLTYLYIYLPNSIDGTTANNQVLYLGQGLKNASQLIKLQYFGISRKS